MLDLDTVYREEGALVYKYLCTLCHDEQLAEELTQETFYQALRSCDRFDGSCKVSTWLCQIAKHLWYRELERRRKHAEPLAEDIPAVDPTAEEQLQCRETVVELFRRAHDLRAFLVLYASLMIAFVVFVMDQAFQFVMEIVYP